MAVPLSALPSLVLPGPGSEANSGYPAVLATHDRVVLSVGAVRPVTVLVSGQHGRE